MAAASQDMSRDAECTFPRLQTLGSTSSAHLERAENYLKKFGDRPTAVWAMSAETASNDALAQSCAPFQEIPCMCVFAIPCCPLLYSQNQMLKELNAEVCYALGQPEGPNVRQAFPRELGGSGEEEALGQTLYLVSEYTHCCREERSDMERMVPLKYLTDVKYGRSSSCCGVKKPSRVRLYFPMGHPAAAEIDKRTLECTTDLVFDEDVFEHAFETIKRLVEGKKAGKPDPNDP